MQMDGAAATGVQLKQPRVYTEECAHIRMAWCTNRTDGALIPRRRINIAVSRWVDETGSLAASFLQRVLRVIFDRGIYVSV